MDLDSTWAKLEEATLQILRNVERGFPMERSMQLYTLVYNYCTTQPPTVASEAAGAIVMGSDLYAKVEECFRGHVVSIARTLVEERDESLLEAYLERWTKFTMALRPINHIFMYLNRFYVPRKRDEEEGSKSVHEVQVLGIVLWQTHVFQALKHRLRAGILKAFAADRAGTAINKAVLRGVIGSVVALGITSLGLYREDVEAPVLEATEEYYQQLAHRLSWELAPAEYAVAVEQALAAELQRARFYLHRDTEQELMSRVERALIGSHIEHLSADFIQFLDSGRTDDLRRLYGLLQRVDGGLDGLRVAFESRIKSVGLEAIRAVAATAAEDPAVFCTTLLTELNRFKAVVAGSFGGDAGFQAVLLKAARAVINQNAVTEASGALKAAELVAKYIDGLLRSDTVESNMDLLDGALLLFRLLDDKARPSAGRDGAIPMGLGSWRRQDVFQRVYSVRLAARLIGGLSTSEDAEAAMLGKLKEVCGFEFTSKMQRMFSDIAVNRELNDKFRQWVSRRSPLPVDFSVLVLATGSWPLEPMQTDLLLPGELENCLAVFSAFYREHLSGRKLQWLYHLSRADVAYNIRPRQRILLSQATAFHVAVLLQYNESPDRSVQQLQAATSLSTPVLMAVLASLVKTKVLLAGAAPGHFVLNDEFRSKKTRVVVAPLQLEATRADEQPQQDDVQDDRRHQIQAAIVRVMKARKVIDHNSLITEVVQMLSSRFRPSVPTIKKSIDLLIEKEYMERSRDDSNMYVYLS